MTRKQIFSVTLGAVTLALGLFAAAAFFRPDSAGPKFESIDVSGVNWGKGFDLQDHTGRRRTLADFHGKAVAITFGFTHCPDMCPTTMAKLGEAMKQLGGKSKQVQVLFVTVDPKRDTPQVLSQYVPAFHPTFLGLSADAATTQRTAKEFKIFYQAQPPNEHGSYTVDHSGQILVFDPTGRLRLLMKPDLAPEIMASDIRLLLKEKSG